MVYVLMIRFCIPQYTKSDTTFFMLTNHIRFYIPLSLVQPSTIKFVLIIDDQILYTTVCKILYDFVHAYESYQILHIFAE